MKTYGKSDEMRKRLKANKEASITMVRSWVSLTDFIMFEERAIVGTTTQCLGPKESDIYNYEGLLRKNRFWR